MEKQKVLFGVFLGENFNHSPTHNCLSSILSINTQIQSYFQKYISRWKLSWRSPGYNGLIPLYAQFTWVSDLNADIDIIEDLF